MTTIHPSDSAEQRRAEPLILAGVSRALGVPIAPKRLELAGGARVDVDGVADDLSAFVEVFAHQGRLRGGQFSKVARDALKLITLARTYTDARLVIAFGDSVAAGCVTGKSWLAEALQVWGVKVMVVELDADVRDALVAAQLLQVMVNTPTGDEP